MDKELRSGYTTGTHATAVFGAVLAEYYKDKELSTLDIVLPKTKLYASIKVKRENNKHYSTIKIDNDDLDVTKGCCIHAELFLTSPKNLKVQKPSLIELGDSKLYIYAGSGIGVVTKKGLKIEPNYPAINPVPLAMMKEIALTTIKLSKAKVLHIVFSVDNGNNIAKDTANEKVGVIGGISILGTRGVVKPISADAYLDSIDVEIAVAEASPLDYIVFTLGNTAHDYANSIYDVSQVVEIGNFIFDASQRLKDRKFKKMIFISSVAKMCKVAQRCKNTHNRFGGIDFEQVKIWVKDELDFDLGDEKYLTLKAILLKLSNNQKRLFGEFLTYKAGVSFKKWFFELGIDINMIKIITINDKEISKGELKW